MRVAPAQLIWRVDEHGLDPPFCGEIAQSFKPRAHNMFAPL